MSTQVTFNKPVNVPVYNIRRDILEATIKANQGATKEVLARAIFDALQSRGLIPCEACFEDYQAAIIGVIKDRDNDGYYDVSIHDLNEALKANFTSSPDGADPIETLQSSPLLESYFKDTVTLSSAAELTVGSAAGNPSLRTMSFEEAIKYFKKTYRSGAWNEERLNRFRADLQLFMDSHFVGTPVETLEEAKNAVSDSLPEVSGDLFSQMSKDGQGRVRVDCGFYAAIYKKLFETVGLKTAFAFLVIATPDGGVGGHLVAYGYKGEATILGNNEKVSIVADGSTKALERSIIDTSKGMGTILSINYAKNPSGALGMANSDVGLLIRYFNSANWTIQENIKMIGLFLSKNDQELEQSIENYIIKKGYFANRAEDILTSEKAKLKQAIARALADITYLEQNAGDSLVINFKGQTLRGKSEITTFTKNYRMVLSLIDRLMEDKGRSLTLTDQELNELKAAKEYFSRFNSSDGKYVMFALANFILNKSS